MYAYIRIYLYVYIDFMNSDESDVTHAANALGFFYARSKVATEVKLCMATDAQKGEPFILIRNSTGMLF